MAASVRVPLLLLAVICWTLQSVRGANTVDVGACTCGFHDPTTNSTWTDAILFYANESRTIPGDIFVKETFQHKWENNINAVYRFGAIPSNIEIANASVMNWNVSSVQLTLDPPTSKHAVVGASLRTVRRDIQYGTFEAYLRPAKQWAGGSALSMALQYNDSQSLEVNVMNTDNPANAWTAFLMNGEYTGSRDLGVNFSDYGNATYNYKNSPWNFVPYRIEWNASYVRFFLGDAVARNASKKTRVPPLAPAPLYFQHYSLGDQYAAMGPPKEPSTANVGLVRAFFNSSIWTKAQHQDYDKRCNHQATCRVGDTTLRGATAFSFASAAKFKEPKSHYFARWPAIILACISGGWTTFLLIHTLFRRAPWRKVTVVGHGAPPPPPPPPPAPAPDPEEIEGLAGEKKHSLSLVPKPLKLKKSIGWSDTATLIGGAVTPGTITPGGHHTPGTLTPGMYTPGAVTPRNLTPPPLPKSSEYFTDHGPFPDYQKHTHHYPEEAAYEPNQDEDLELDPLDDGRRSKYSSASSSTLGDGPHIRVTKPSTGFSGRQGSESSHYSRSIKGFHDETFINPFEDPPPVHKEQEHPHIKFAETTYHEPEFTMEREMDELHQEFEDFDNRAHPALVERAERVEHTKAPKKARVDYLAGLVAMGCLVVSMTHIMLTFIPAVEIDSIDAHYKSERFAYKYITPFLLLFSWIGPFFTTSARFLVWNYLEHGDLLNIAEKVVGRAPRLVIPCAAIAALEYFGMQMGAIKWLSMLPSVSWSTWPYTGPYPNFGHYLSEVLELLYIIPNAVPVITFNYCTGVLWTIPVQLQNSWVTLLGVIVVYEIKTPWKRFGYYLFCIVNNWYAISWGSFFWLGLAIADLDITYHWKRGIYARPALHYSMLLVVFCVTVGSQSTDLVPRFKTFVFDTQERNIHPDIPTGKPIGQTADSGYPPYYVPRLSALTFAVGAQLLLELSPFLQRLMSAGWLMLIFPHVLSIYLIHGFILWSWGAFVCVHLDAAGVPYWANMLITIATSYTIIFLALPLVTPVVDTLGKTISEEIWEVASTKPPPRRRSLYPFPLTLFEGATENYGGNLKDVKTSGKTDA